MQRIATFSSSFALAALLVVGCAGGDQPSGAEPGASLSSRDDARTFLGLPATAPLPVASTFTGTLTMVLGTRADGHAVPSRYFLGQDNGEVLELGVSAVAEASSLDRRRVTVSGFRAGGKLAATAVRPLAQAFAVTPLALTGARPFATVLCRFSDSTGVTPEEVPFFQALMGNSFPGLDHYWRETSYGNISLAGSQVFGWYDLPNPRSFYVTVQPDGTQISDLPKLAKDCFGAGNADIDYTQFQGVNLMFNENLDGAAWGGHADMPFDGMNGASMPTTWMPPWGYHSQNTLGQEMGHSFGLMHSSGPYSETYDSTWDVMSAGSCKTRDPAFGCVADGTIAFHKDKLGWIPASRKAALANAVSVTTYTLARLEDPPADGLLMIKIPLSFDGNLFYTVEARRFQGYDNGVPHEGVLIHEVDLTRPDRTAQVVDPDNNGEVNDLGATWTVGETFTDLANGISVQVLSETASGFSVRVTVAGQQLTVNKVLANGGTGSVTSSPAGINCGAICSQMFLTHSVVSLHAVGATFAGWEGCDTASGPTCIVTMDSARTVKASFGHTDPACYQTCFKECRASGTPAGECVKECRDECTN